MDAGSEVVEAELIEILTASARRISSGVEPPYEGGMRLTGQLGHVLEKYYYAGHAFAVWAELTDGIDGPSACARGLTPEQILDLMRVAATEWLALDPQPESVRRYLDRWRSWPDFPAPTD